MMHHRVVTSAAQQHADSRTLPVAAAGQVSTASSTSSSSSAQPTRKRRYKKKVFQAYYGKLPTSFFLIALVGASILVGCAVYIGRQISQGLQHRRQKIHLNPHDYDDEESSEDGLPKLPWNPMYRVKDSIDIVGDRSDRYAKLRRDIDPLLPDDVERSLNRVQELQTQVYSAVPIDAHNSDQVDMYDIYDCPETPPAGYPYAWNILTVLNNWPPDDPKPRPNVYQGLCVFDYQKDYEKALNYRNAELPFVIVNDPEVAKTVERWNTPGYMESLLGSEMHRCEYSEDNHFMYYMPVSKNKKRRKRSRMQVPEGWEPPTRLIRMRYKDWLEKANVTEDKLGPDQPHWYYRLIGCGLMGNEGTCDKGSSEYLYDEMPYFQPKPDSFYVVEHEEQKGIHCRFGMKGVIAENHFDGSRNAIALLGGSRRYILAHPDQCEKLALFPKGHPSARHSAVDWSEPNLSEFPEFANARANEVVMQPGQVMYLPTNWFHYIISLSINWQCNTRSGITTEYMAPIRQCGF